MSSSTYQLEGIAELPTASSKEACVWLLERAVPRGPEGKSETFQARSHGAGDTAAISQLIDEILQVIELGQRADVVELMPRLMAICDARAASLERVWLGQWDALILK